MLLNNAQISLKVQLLVILMGVCLCLEDGSSDVPAPLSVMHWELWFHTLPVKVAIIKRMIALVIYLFRHWKLLILQKPINTEGEREHSHILGSCRGKKKKKRAEGNLHLSLMICTWIQPSFQAKLWHSRMQFHSWSKALCLSQPDPLWGWERTVMVLGLKCSVHSKIYFCF